MDLRDPDVLRLAHERYSRRVHAAANRILKDPAQAEDAAQDVFLRLWRNPDAFDGHRGDLGTYLCLMARSRAIDLWRARQSHTHATERLASVSFDPVDDVDPSTHLERSDLATRVRTAVRTLPPVQREAVALAYWGEMSPDEIGRRTGVPKATARSRVRLGVAKLQAAEGLQAA